MANTFYREAIDGGDSGVWAIYEQSQNRLALATISCKLYNDAGTLKLGKGLIGLDNGSVKGSCVIDTITTIDLSSVSNSNWAKIEITNSGSGINITANNIASATDPKTLPADFTNAYDGEKGGFYIDTAKRIIGLAWKNASGTLEGVINTFGGTDGYIGSSLSDDASDYRHQFFKAGNYEPYKVFSEKKEITVDETVTASTKRKELICKTNDLRVNLPALATVDEFELTIFNASGAMVHIDPNGAETVNGIADLFSKTEGDLIKLEKLDGKWRITNSWMPYFYSGSINRSDWTDVHLGFATITYNNLSGTFRLGEKVTGANGSYGWVIYNNGSTSMVLVWVVCVGANIFNNTEVITGSISGATAAVNMASGLKNVDSNIYHGFSNSLKKINVRFFVSSDGTENNSFEICGQADAATGNHYGWASLQVDANNIKLQTATLGMFNLLDSGSFNVLDNEDYFYNLFVKLLTW